MAKGNHKEIYQGQVSKEELQNKFFMQYNYNFWMHKARALLYFIKNQEAIKNLKFTGDMYSDEVIIENLKMELHMMVFHSAESLFRMIFSIIKMPELPWIWIARCGHSELYGLIDKMRRDGLASLKPSPEIWLRPNLYPSIINEQHENYEKSRLSCGFVIKYLESLATEYIDHKEYNSYKHGLHCFCGRQELQAIDEQTGEKVFASQNDIIEFLEFEKEKKKEEVNITVRIAAKSYDYSRDYQIIIVTSAILHNLFNKKSIDLKKSFIDQKAVSGDSPLKFGYYLMHDWTLDDVFLTESDRKGASLLKRFSF